MSSVRERIQRQLSGKVYPNPSDPETAKKLADGIKQFEQDYLGSYFPWILSGTKYVPASFFTTVDPNSPAANPHIIGKFEQYFPWSINPHTEAIRDAGRRFFEKNPWPKRVELLEMISRVVKERFWLLCAAKMYETGQSVAEAIGETDEEVDFPLVNAMYLEELNRDLLIPSPKFASDLNGKCFFPHGVFLDVEPFNFPGAIPIDMATKALAMGNAVIMKPSPKASLCGYLVWESIRVAFERTGIGWDGVINYAPGGKEVVDAFLSSPHVSGLSFTGSSEVFRAIRRNYRDFLRYGYHGKAELVYGSAETSGVNIFVVCEDADPIHAAKEYVKSFIGRSGQKCSSARIAFVDRNIQTQFMQTTLEQLEQIRYGDVKQGTYLGAMITVEAKNSLAEKIEELEHLGIVFKLYQKKIDEVSASDFPPTVLMLHGSIDNRYATWKVMNTEFFGPVSTVVPFGNLDEVEQMCKRTEFALTGSVFCRDLEALKRMMSVIPAGNLYWNRKCTGALVETECFGGLRSASSPNGVKGKNALALFGSQQTFSGFYPAGADEEYRKAAQEVLARGGMNLSKQ
ncbi:MAG: aldehyde dehydrogenase family protein [Candidatus Niyogibacteria bacterium]|nr:MAG: aldehyde dehydrogenase family protein [Candidatus Niyogibacteria bacterium]